MAKKKRIKAATRHANLRNAHRHLYEETLAWQGGHCALCPNVPVPGGPRFHLDHNHGTMIVRGVLCPRCNRFGVRDWMTPEWAAALEKYLDDPPMQQLLRAQVV